MAVWVRKAVTTQQIYDYLAAVGLASKVRDSLANRRMRKEMHNGLKASFATLTVVVLSLLFNQATADPELGVGTPDEIRIGSVMPYTGPLAAFASIGRTEAAYFQMTNDRGGINGHKLRLISYDDSSDPMRAYDQTRKLVENDNVLLIFGS